MSPEPFAGYNRPIVVGSRRFHLTFYGLARHPSFPGIRSGGLKASGERAWKAEDDRTAREHPSPNFRPAFWVQNICRYGGSRLRRNFDQRANSTCPGNSCPDNSCPGELCPGSARVTGQSVVPCAVRQRSACCQDRSRFAGTARGRDRSIDCLLPRRPCAYL